MTFASGLFPIVSLLVQESRPEGVNRIRVGESATGALSSTHPSLGGRGPEKRYLFLLESTETVTISLESFDFDAFLRVEDESGGRIAGDDNGGVETNARLVLEARAGARYGIVAAASEEGAGEFTLSVAKGDVPRPSGAALIDAGIAFRSKAAERSLARGDKAGAQHHRLQEGLRCFSRGQYAQALSAYGASLTLARELGDLAGEAAALGNLGVTYFSLGEPAKARERFEEVLPLARKLGDRRGEATALGGLGNAFAAMGDPTKAREHHELHLAVARETGDRAAEALALGNLGNVFYSLADFPKAREHYELQLALARKVGDRAGEGRAFGSLGNVLLSLGSYAEARKRYEESLAVARELGDRAGEAKNLGNLGNVCFFLGDYPRAREHFEKRIDLARELGSRAGVAGALGNLGNVCFALGDLPKAREHYEKHRDLAREMGDRAAEATALGNLGNVSHSLGDVPEAREHYERWLTIVRELGDRAGEMRALGALGAVFTSFGDRPRALEHYEAQLALAQELGDRAAEASAHGNLGDAFLSSGDGPEAREHMERRLEIARELGERVGEARALAGLGGLYLALADLARARESASGSLAIYSALGAELGSLYPLATLARCSLAEGEPRAAREALKRAESILDRASTRALGIAEASGQRARFAEFAEISQDLMALQAEEAGSNAAERLLAVAEGFRTAGRWKGRGLLHGIAEHRSGARTPEANRLRREGRETLASRDRVLDRLSEAIRKGRPEEEIETLREEARALEAREDDLRRRLAGISPRDAALDLPAGAEPEAVRAAALDERTALVEYAEGASRLYAYVLTAKGLVYLELGERKTIEAAAGAYAFSESSLELATPLEAIAEKGRALFEGLLAPVLREAGPGIGRLVVVPTPTLATLPFESLVMGRKREGPAASFQDLEFVLDRYELCYAPSSPVLVELASLGPRRGEDKILVLSDPVYPGESGEPPGDPESRPAASTVAWGGRRAAPEPGRLERLRKTREEAVGLVGMLVGPEEEATAAALTRLSDRRSASVSGRFFDLHLGAEASRRRLAGDLRKYSVLHFAAHGYVDREFPQRTGIALSFAGGEDGFYTIGDVLDGLDVDAKFVVLSACDTARGEVKRGEGVESMARAFMYAGARGVVASLWEVADWAAAETMGVFYRGALKRGLPPSQALWEA